MIEDKLKSLIDFTLINPVNSADWHNELVLVSHSDLLPKCADTFMNGVCESVAIVPPLTDWWYSSVFNYAHAFMLFQGERAIVFYLHDRKRIMSVAKHFIDIGGKLLPGYTLA